MFDVAEDALGLRLVHEDAVARREVLRIKVAVASARFRRDRYHVTQHILNNAVRSRVEARYFDFFLIRTTIPRKGVAVALCGTRPEIHVVHRLVSRRTCRRSGALVACKSFLRLRGVEAPAR